MSGKVLILGNPILREISKLVTEYTSEEIKNDIYNLKKELEDFRKLHGFGRGIAAVQIGIKKRFIALNIGNGPFVIINPEFTYKSIDTFTMWDDCMSFPDLLVRVERFKIISIRYQDEDGLTKEWKEIDQEIAELLQHEIDHLDGILAIDNAILKTDIIYKNEYYKNKEKYDKMVEYQIRTTIKNDF